MGAEFPRVDERRVGRKHRFGYVAARASAQAGGGLPQFSDVRRYDLERGTTTVRRFGAQWVQEFCTADPEIEPGGASVRARGKVAVCARSVKLLRRVS